MSGDGSYVVESDIKQQQYVDLIGTKHMTVSKIKCSTCS